MIQTKISLPPMKMVGIIARTSTMAEMNPLTAKIPTTVQQYFHEGLAQTIPHRKSPGVTYCAYTCYESDYRGEYTYFIGEEVTADKDIKNSLSKLEVLEIPAQTYAKFTHGPGPMPLVCIQGWQHIWMMTPENLGGTRAYVTDFEVYDERAHDPQQVTLDIFVGVEFEKKSV